jgi:nucleoside-diphosphate-sugar epimerase
MNVLVTGSKGYIGQSIINSKNKRINYFEGSRQTIDLFNKENIKDFIKKNKIDSIIHCAIEGGSRLKKDDSSVFYNNILIFENLYYCRKLINKFINLASGAEFDRETDINLKKEEEIFNCVPKDYYGLSKNIISQKVISVKKFYNLRIFGCFDENELNTRFIKSSIIKSKLNQNIIINEDKKMDFFYLKDLINVIEHALFFDLSDQDINLSYPVKYKLSEIAQKIIDKNNSKSEIIILNQNCLNYNGDSKKLFNTPIYFNGLETGIQNTINKII